MSGQARAIRALFLAEPAPRVYTGERAAEATADIPGSFHDDVPPAPPIETRLMWVVANHGILATIFLRLIAATTVALDG